MRLAVGAALALGIAGSALAADIDTSKIDEREFTVVGTWGDLALWQDHESRPWNEVLPEASGGEITSNAKRYTELGISGLEVMRLLELGTYDAVHALTSYTSQDSPALEGLDPGGVIQDLDTYPEAAEPTSPSSGASWPTSTTPSSSCSIPSPASSSGASSTTPGESGLDDIAGKEVRSFSNTQGDFIEGLGATPVNIAFAEVVRRSRRATAASRHRARLQCQVVPGGERHLRTRIGYAATFLAVNKDTWESLSPETQELIKQKATEVEEGMWKATAQSDRLGMACNADGPCPWGEPGGMTPVEMSEEDKAKLKDVIENVVLKRFVERCGEELRQAVGRDAARSPATRPRSDRYRPPFPGGAAAVPLGIGGVAEICVSATGRGYQAGRRTAHWLPRWRPPFPCGLGQKKRRVRWIVFPLQGWRGGNDAARRHTPGARALVALGRLDRWCGALARRRDDHQEEIADGTHDDSSDRRGPADRPRADAAGLAAVPVAAVLGILSLGLDQVYMGGRLRLAICEFTWDKQREFILVAVPMFICSVRSCCAPASRGLP